MVSENKNQISKYYKAKAAEVTREKK